MSTDIEESDRSEYDSDGNTGSRSLLSNVFGTRGKAEIIAVLVTKSNQDLSVTEIADLAGLDRSAAYDPLRELVDIGLVEESRQVSNSMLYQINRDSDSARLIAELQFALAEEFSEQIQEQQDQAE